MKEIETKKGAVKVYCAGPHTYLRTSACVQPTKERPAPELIEGQQVRLSIDEARIVGKALLRCVAEAEEHVEFQRKLEMRRNKARAPVFDVFDVPAFARPVATEAELIQKEKERMDRLRAEAKQRNRKKAKPKLAEQVAEDPLKMN